MVWNNLSDFFNDPFKIFKTQWERFDRLGREGNREIWHQDIDWVDLSEGFKKSNSLGKPLAVIIKSYKCPACQRFRENLRKSYFLPETAKEFVMVVTEYTDVPDDIKFHPDGRYVPRILFFDSKGNLMPHYYNQYGHSMRKYFYPDSWILIDTMLQIMKDQNNLII